jgi:hypothetical protein
MGECPLLTVICDLDGGTLFDDNLNVLAYSFTDGTHALNNQNSTSVFNLEVGGGSFNGGGTFTGPHQWGRRFPLQLLWPHAGCRQS